MSTVLTHGEEKEELMDLNNRLEVLIKELGPRYRSRTSESRTTSVLQLESVVQTLQDQIDNGNAVIAELRGELDKICQEKDDIILDSRRKDTDIDALTDQISDLTQQLEAALKKQEALESAADASEARADDLQAELDALTSGHSGSARELQELRQELAEALESKSQIEQERDGLMRQVGALRSERDAGSRKADSYQQDLADLQARLTTAQKQRLGYQHDSEGALADLEEAKAKIADLQEKLDATRQDLRSVRDDKEQQEKANTDLANRNQTLEEDNEYVKLELERKNKALSSLTIQIKEITKSKTETIERDYNIELSQALAELREQYGAEANAYRHEIRALFESQLHDAKFALNQAKLTAEEAVAAREAAEQAASDAEADASDLEERLRVEQERNASDRAAHNVELQRRQDLIDSLEEQLLDLQRRLKEAKSKPARQSITGRSAQLERELEEHRREFAQQSQMYKQLLGEKLALDREIALYKKWLGEGERLVFGSEENSPWRKRARALESGQEDDEEVVEVVERRTKRSRPAQEDTAASFNSRSELEGIEARTTTVGPVHIDTLDLDGWFVKLNNLTTDGVDLSKWTLTMQIEGEDEAHTFSFPRRFLLEGNESVTIWSATSPEAQHKSGDLVWDSLPAFQITDGSSVVLSDKAGEVVSQADLVAALFEEGEQIFHASGDEQEETAGNKAKSSWFGAWF